MQKIVIEKNNKKLKPISEVESELVRKIEAMKINEVSASISRKNGDYSIEVILMFREKEKKYQYKHPDYAKGADIIYKQIKNELMPKDRIVPF